MMDITAKWKDNKGVWQDFDLIQIGHQSRNHAIALFKRKLPVVALENGVYITNNKETQKKYLDQGKQCKLFSEMQSSEKTLKSVGFLG
jgi:hypothetical protein